VSVSVTIGVSVMIGSFRSTVVTWLAETLQGELYVSAPGLSATTPSIPLEPSAVEIIRQTPGVESVYVLRAANVDSPAGMVSLAATDNQNVAQERLFLGAEAAPEFLWERMLQGAVLVSEPFANRFGLSERGGSVTRIKDIRLYTSQGERTFPVVGVYYDYASTQGTVLMALPVYQQYWDDRSVTALALQAEPGADIEQLARQLQTAVASVQQLVVRPNQVLRAEVLSVFDRTFAITSALQLLATLVAFIGVLSALLSLELERMRELGILRSIGLTARQLWALILLETGLMGGIAGLLAMPTGYLLSLILVYIINRRSFGWTLQMQVEPGPFLQALAIALLAALLAGIYPALRMSRMLAAEALRAE
ncbi:MAG: ABC transporter permease, partial [Chloroflexi bacterium]|nr:ABC transporter permease [Chloroflexota bacterium]